MARIDINMDGAARLRAKLPELTGVALQTAGMIPMNAAKLAAPVKTGTLRRSIHVGGRGGAGITGSPLQPPRREGDRVTIQVGTNLEYAAYVEFGTGRQKAKPYLVPALNNNKTEIQSEFTTVLRKLLDNEA